MKVSPNIERGVHILLILALAQKEQAVSSQILSQLLEESDSSVKKLLTKLSKAGFVAAREGKEGGFYLAKEIGDISLLDAWLAVEEEIFHYQLSGISHRLFTLPQQVGQAEARLEMVIQKAEQSFRQEIALLSLDQLLVTDFKERALDWKKLVEERKHG